MAYRQQSFPSPSVSDAACTDIPACVAIHTVLCGIILSDEFCFIRFAGGDSIRTEGTDGSEQYVIISDIRCTAMRIGLVSYRNINRDISFNISQIERALKESRGKADLLCFGEAFLQGFDSLCWNYETDQFMAVNLDSGTMNTLRDLTVRYDTALLTGYIEKEDDHIYSSCVVLDHGRIVHNYRRISGGWKESAKTDDHYREGTETGEFCLRGKRIMPALCGDIWNEPERFRTDSLLIWPVFVDYTVEEWNSGALDEYARQTALVSKDTLMVNPVADDPVNHGGSFRFENGSVTERIPFDTEGILIVAVD